MSASRAFAQRSSALRTLTRQAAPRSLYASPAARRGYASAHDAASKSSDLPWLLASAGVTVVGVWYLTMGPGAPAKQSKHGHGIDVDHAAKAETEEQPKQHTGTDESALAAGDAKSENEIGPRGADDPQNPDKRAAVGRDVPPLSDDNKDLAENWDERKEKKQEFDALVREGHTRVASASSDAPSKRKAGEHPREDPKKGKGEAVHIDDSSKND